LFTANKSKRNLIKKISRATSTKVSIIGIISNKFKQLGSIGEDKRKEFASELNFLKNELQKLLNKLYR